MIKKKTKAEINLNKEMIDSEKKEIFYSNIKNSRSFSQKEKQKRTLLSNNNMIKMGELDISIDINSESSLTLIEHKKEIIQHPQSIRTRRANQLSQDKKQLNHTIVLHSDAQSGEKNDRDLKLLNKKRKAPSKLKQSSKLSVKDKNNDLKLSEITLKNRNLKAEKSMRNSKQKKKLEHKNKVSLNNNNFIRVLI